MTLEDELLSELEPSVKTGEVVVESSSDDYFSELESRFPVLGSKIDWDEVPGSVQEEASADTYAAGCQNFFGKMVGRYGLSGKCIVIGDSAIEVALVMSVGVLRRYLKNILSVPQHHYILASDYSWCMSFAMEGDMAFGFYEAE